MKESDFGKEDSKGNWLPNKKISYAPLLNWPIKPLKIIKWIFGGIPLALYLIMF